MVFRPPCLCRGKDKPRDTMIDLAPLPIALTKPRRLSDRPWDHVDIVNYSPINQVVNSEHVDAADATDRDR